MDKKMTLDDFHQMKCADLRNFLRSNNQKISGSKDDLVRRAYAFNKEHYAAQPSSTDEGDIIRDKIDGDTPCIKELGIGWSSRLGDIPKMSYKEVEKYLIHSRHRAGDKRKMQCYRQFIRGYNFFKEKYIHKLMVNAINKESNLCYVRSKCFPSMKQGTYTQWILLTKESPRVIKANCSCPAGLGEGCAHIAGLLFALEANGKCEDDDVPCTSKPCQWSKGSKRKREPSKIKNIKFKKFKFGKEDIEETNHDSFIYEPNGSFRKTICSKLDRSKNPAALFDLLPSSDSTLCVPVESDINVISYQEVCTSDHIQSDADEYVDLEKVVSREGMTPGKHMLMANVSSDIVNEIEQITKGQAENKLWHLGRKMRITATSFHGYQDNCHPDNYHRAITTRTIAT